MNFVRFYTIILIIICFIACTKENDSISNGANPVANSSSFTVAPLDISNIAYIIALGNLNPPGHTVPTSHIYLRFDTTFSSPLPVYNVYAPSAGTVIDIYSFGPDAKITIEVNDTLYYFLGHVIPSVSVGEIVDAGDVVGTTSQMSGAVDLGVINKSTMRNLANPSRYPETILYGTSPIQIFIEPLRTTLYSKVRRYATDKDGIYDYDIVGKLIGNWFLDGVAEMETFQPQNWEKHLAFVYDNYYPSKMRISIGGTICPNYQYGIDVTSTIFENVSVASGLMIYKIYNINIPAGENTSHAGYLLVQMITDTQIEVEAFIGATSPPGSFTINSKSYER